MASESELRDRFHEGTLPSGRIDVEAVLRRVPCPAPAAHRARRRRIGAGDRRDRRPRRARQLRDVRRPTPRSSPASGGDSGADLGAGGRGRRRRSRPIDRPPAEKLNLCSAPVAEVAPAENGLVLTVEPVTASAGDHGIPTIVTMTNTGSAPVSGTTGRPARDDAVAGRRHALAQQRPADHDRDPGRARARRVAAVPGHVRAGALQRRGRHRRDVPRRTCPRSAPGLYQLSAAIDFTRNDGSFIDLVTGPAVRVSLN